MTDPGLPTTEARRAELIRILRQTAAPSIRRAELGADAILDSSWVAGLVAERQELQAENERWQKWATDHADDASNQAATARAAIAERDRLQARIDKALTVCADDFLLAAVLSDDGSNENGS